ncbi:MAG TPA: cupin domain-containing protein [Actinomycetota bacterium]
MGQGVSLIRPGDRTEGPFTPGMTREQAAAGDGMWAGFVRTDPGMLSGWHHHGDNESVIYVLSGTMRMEFGPGGADVVEARPGDFLVVAKEAVHREANPTDQEGTAIVVRAGSGPSLYNTDGPQSDVAAEIK